MDADVRMKIILKVAKDYGLDIEKKKCQLLKTKIEFLGFIIDDGRVQPSNDKTVAIKNYPQPMTLEQIQSFLGLTGYFPIVDYFSKFTWLYACKSTTTKEVIDCLEKQKQVFGNPSIIITDRGTAFTAEEFKNYCIDEGIQNLTITTGVPRGNGQVERVNCIIIPVLTELSLEDPGRWFKYVERVQKALGLHLLKF
ncbi:hypothetical protein JTB14_026561 [Gonioctena quinquepunctata]|nr:hypothetical protein JTB14_026561 [Gonioctena quinquepunctata]